MKGSVIPISHAAIPVNDWGLVHSDITCDVVPVIKGAFFRLDDYLDRFMCSMESLRLNPK
jgi:branched-chain amino acid aminotransferase